MLRHEDIKLLQEALNELEAGGALYGDEATDVIKALIRMALANYEAGGVLD